MAITLPNPYAEVDDLQEYWRPLSDGEQTRAARLLGWAAHRINQEPGFKDKDSDELTDAQRLDAAQVSMDMVKRAMINGDGVLSSTTSQTMLDMSAGSTQRYANPMGNLYLTDGEKDRLAGRTGQRGGSIALSSNVRVPGEPWNSQPSAQADHAGS